MLAFNRGRVMVLPQGINKATGLREVLNTIRLSLHNCIGIGDAENDHALLEACEIGVAVSWGSSTLQAVADDILQGTGSEAIANYIREVITHLKLPPIARMTGVCCSAKPPPVRWRRPSTAATF